MSSSHQMHNAVDVAQASELTGLSKKALRRRLERGTLNSVKVGGRRMIPVSELLQHGLLDTSAGSEGSPAVRPPASPTAPERQSIATPAPRPTQPAPQAPVAPEPAPTAPQGVAAPQTPVARPQTVAESQAAPAPPTVPVAQTETVPQAAATPRPTAAPQKAATQAPQAAPEVATTQLAPPPERGAPAYPPGQPVPVPGEPPIYPPRGASYYWYEYPALRWLAVILAIAAVALLVWLLTIRSDGGESTAVVQPGGGPVGATEADLVTLSQELGQPVYWAGTMSGTRLEITESNNRYAYLRYLTEDSPVGDPSPDFLTVGTYPSPDAYTNLRSYAQHEHADTTRIQNSGLAVTVPGSPTSVYFAYPHEDVQVEVYDPEPKRALDLVKSGVVRPVTTSTTTSSAATTVPSTPTVPEGTLTVVPQG